MLRPPRYWASRSNSFIRTVFVRWQTRSWPKIAPVTKQYRSYNSTWCARVFRVTLEVDAAVRGIVHNRAEDWVGWFWTQVICRRCLVSDVRHVDH